MRGVAERADEAQGAALRRLAVGVATGFGAGYSPIWPGTVGTALALPLAWASSGWAPWAYALMGVAVAAVGAWSADVADAAWGTHDDGRIVVDEVAGFLVAAAAIDRSDPLALLAAFVLFRVFDILKPGPVRWVDARVRGGVGVVADDLAAGALAAAVLWAAYR